jgi:hypothetical protein
LSVEQPCPILKERVFGPTNSEANHGEDVKDYYFYLDCTPTHSYMKYLYKYPQAEFPYLNLIETNGRRGRLDPEYELLDTGIFDGDRYFDIFVEYAKATPKDLLIEITIHNRGPNDNELHVLPTLWFRNISTWWSDEQKPSLHDTSRPSGIAIIAATDAKLGGYDLYCEGHPDLLFIENETNNRRLFESDNPTPYVKDGINDYVVAGKHDAVNPKSNGTKAAAHYRLLGARSKASIRLRLSNDGARAGEPFGTEFAQTLAARKSEADEFYRAITPAGVGEDAANVMRQALAGMLWDARRERIPGPAWDPGALPLSRRSPVFLLGARPGKSGELAGRVGHRHVRRKLELARTDLDAG